MNNDSRIQAITASLEALNALVCEAATRTTEANDYLLRGDRNAAIGTILDIEVMLTDAIALYRAAIALHRRSPP